SITSQIRKYMELPNEEEPTLATITDINKLKDQDFFKKAKNGDKVLIYAKARKAILYRPSGNKVIEFAPLILGVNQQSQNQIQETKIAIYNGSKKVGLTNEIEKQISDFKNIKIVSKENAKKNNYNETIIVDLTGKNEELTKQISEKINGKITKEIPKEETVSEADILIIAAK
ncbi:MAG: hypothetical protein N2558_05435, partial [Patescibacteria group bacterium]|nr:hypothetical protein [Patescibacteria group bacterium]